MVVLFFGDGVRHAPRDGGAVSPSKAPDWEADGNGFRVRCHPFVFTGIFLIAGVPRPIEREQQFRSTHAHFESDYFLVVTYLPPEQTEEKILAGGCSRAIVNTSRALSGHSTTSRGESAALKISSVRFFR